MDAEHRHELKTNELADWISHAPQYLRDNAFQIIGVILIIVGIITWPVYTKTRKKANLQRQAQRTEVIQQVALDKLQMLQKQAQANQEVPQKTTISADLFLDSADSLSRAATETKEPHLAVLAWIKKGEALRADLHYKEGEVEESVILNHISKAKKAYEKAIELANKDYAAPGLVAMAQYGLGLCAEELGQYDQARQIYEEISTNPDYEGTVFIPQAKLRLEIMADFQEKFTFVDAPKPEPETTAAPIAIDNTENLPQNFKVQDGQIIELSEEEIKSSVDTSKTADSSSDKAEAKDETK